jgi:two-component system KDP operon response regulator KdpE
MTSTGAHILVVDDEPAIVRAVSTLLTGRGFRVEIAETASEVIDGRAYWRSDLILLDLGLPDAEGFEVIKAVREHSGTPIIVLSVRGSEADKVRALNLGADDYLTKPFGVDELLARIQVALRHAAHPEKGADATFRTSNLSVDLAHRQVSVGGVPVHLTRTEYDLLKALVTHANKLLTEEMLLRQVWGPEYGSEGHYLHVYIARLRKKLETDPQVPRFLVTEPGVGYRLLTDEV